MDIIKVIVTTFLTLNYDYLFRFCFGLVQIFHAHLLDHGLPDLVRHPGWCALRLVHLHSLACEYVHLLGTAFTQLDIGVVSISGLVYELYGLTEEEIKIVEGA